MPTDPEYLRNFSCFRDLSESQVSALAQITDSICYPAGYVLFEEGQPGKRLFFLVKGDVEVFYKIGEEGGVRVDSVSGEEMVGCAALVDPYVYTATERSRTDVEVLEMDAVALRKLMQQNCLLGFTLQQYMIRVLMERILDLRLSAA